MQPSFLKESAEALERLRPVRFEMDAGSALQLLGAIQLACRHPDFVGHARENAETIGRALQKVTPNLAAICEAGWNPAFDLPFEERRAE